MHATDGSWTYDLTLPWHLQGEKVLIELELTGLLSIITQKMKMQDGNKI